MDAWRAKTLVAVLATAGVFVGCGASNRGPASTPQAAAPTLASGHAVNLHPGDVPDSVVSAVQEPGFVVRVGREGPVSSGPLDAWIERCDGGIAIAGSREVAGYSSPHFTRGIHPAASLEGVRSVVFVFGSEAAAAHELSVLASARARSCLQLDGNAIGGPGHETHLKVASLPTAPHSGVTGLSWSAIPSSYAPPRRRYQDLLAFTAGRMLVVLHAVGTPHPFQAALEARLLGLLYSRANAHRL